MKSFRIFRHGTLTILEIPLTEKEIQECLKMGERRTKLNEQKLGWLYRHHGLPSLRAHAIGFMGEKGFEKFLDSKGFIKGVDYVRNDPFVKRYEEIKQDYTIRGREIGIKSADNDSLEDATKYGTFLYPAKMMEEESKRVLPYPDYLIQTVVSTNKKKCWICGFVDKKTIKKSPIRWVVGKPAHRIPIEKYRPVTEILRNLKTQERNR